MLPVRRSSTASGLIWHVWAHVWAVLGVTTLLLGKRPAQSRPSDTTTHYATRVGERELDRTMLLVLWNSFRDKRQQKGFQRKYSSISLYALHLGYWFKYETCTPQEKQTNTDFSFFLF